MSNSGRQLERGHNLFHGKKSGLMKVFPPEPHFCYFGPKKRGDDVFHADTSHVNKAGLFHDVPKFLP